MKVYHGSYVKITEIDLSKCKPNKDFGKDFYVTKFRRHAETWATIIGRKYRTEGFVTEFDYTESDFARSICKVKRFDDYNDEWLDFIVMNRDKNVNSPAHDYDIVEGPVADDKIQTRIGVFLKGDISKQDFLQELKYHEETHQICFCTVNSLQLLDYVAPINDIPYGISHIGEPLLEQLMLDNRIDETQATELFYTSKTFTQLADESSELYKRSWTEIYEMLKKEIGK
ncbi:MAG: DUF3990 domain-containing protein [Prevotellaceae bacterium]|jgi:hypothetical protein|nr:DUF3990 domain-containing protein [Prevotellaceae bacterium]